MHFGPVSSRVFESPLSYWNREYCAHWAGPLEPGVSMILCLLLLDTVPALVDTRVNRRNISVALARQVVHVSIIYVTEFMSQNLC